MQNQGSFPGATIGSSEDGRGGGSWAEASLAQMQLVNVTEARWMSEGLCKGSEDPEIWFLDPPQGNYNSGRVWSEAKLVCAQCPVARQCLQYALEHNEEWGVWGGLGPLERAELMLDEGKKLEEIRMAGRRLKKRPPVSNKDKTECKNGHPFTPESTRLNKIVVEGREVVRRGCIPCEQERKARRKAHDRQVRAIAKGERLGIEVEKTADMAEMARRVVEAMEAQRAEEKALRDLARREKTERRLAELRKAAERMRKSPEARNNDRLAQMLKRARTAQHYNKPLKPEWVRMLRDAGELREGYRLTAASQKRGETVE